MSCCPSRRCTCFDKNREQKRGQMDVRSRDLRPGICIDQYHRQKYMYTKNLNTNMSRLV